MDVVASLLEGFLWITIAGSDHLASLKEREAANETLLRASRTTARMKTAPNKSPLMNKLLPFLLRGSVDGGRIGSWISCVSFSKGKHKDIKAVSYTHLTLPTKRIV